MKNLINKIKYGAMCAQNKMVMAMAGVKTERESGDHLLEVLGVIIIAVVLLVFFRGALVNMFQTAISNTQTQVTGLFNPA